MALRCLRAGVFQAKQTAVLLRPASLAQAGARLSVSALLARPLHVHASGDPSSSVTPLPGTPPRVSSIVQGTGLGQSFDEGWDGSVSATAAQEYAPLQLRPKEGEPASLASVAGVSPTPALTGSAGVLRLDQTGAEPWGPWGSSGQNQQQHHQQQKRQQQHEEESDGATLEKQRDAGVRMKLAMSSPVEDVI